MKVYIVRFSWLLFYDDEVLNVVGAYNSKDKANEIAKRICSSGYFRQSLLTEKEKNRLDPDFQESWECSVQECALDKEFPLFKDEMHIPCDE